MEKLKMMKENLVACVQSQMSNLCNVNAKELGEAIDMIKDLDEAMYYCSIVKAMEESKEEKQHYYQPIMYYPDNSNNMNTISSGSRSYYQDEMYPAYLPPHDAARYIPNKMKQEYGRYPMEIRDYREGRSPISRRTYMESKEMHMDSKKQRQELEKYMNELASDIMEMIDESTPDEKAVLSQKLIALAEKIK